MNTSGKQTEIPPEELAGRLFALSRGHENSRQRRSRIRLEREVSASAGSCRTSVEGPSSSAAVSGDLRSQTCSGPSHSIYCDTFDVPTPSTADSGAPRSQTCSGPGLSKPGGTDNVLAEDLRGLLDLVELETVPEVVQSTHSVTGSDINTPVASPPLTLTGFDLDELVDLARLCDESTFQSFQEAYSANSNPLGLVQE